MEALIQEVLDSPALAVAAPHGQSAPIRKSNVSVTDRKLMHKPTKEQILQALDDLDEGKPISADMRFAVNQYQRHRVETHLEQEANAETVQEHATQIRAKALTEEWVLLHLKSLATGLTPQEWDRFQRLWMFGRHDYPQIPS